MSAQIPPLAQLTNRADTLLEAQIGVGEQRWSQYPAVLDTLKARARSLGLWNLFLPRTQYPSDVSPGLTNLEYALMAEWMGRSRSASEATNCQAPDTGNMEVLAKYGNEAQKRQWLQPLLDGEIRSAFLMTEPGVASSDARNIRLRIRRDTARHEWVLNGEKWWSSGAGDPRCQVYLVMGSLEEGDAERGQSVVIVPADTAGITIHRMMSVYGYDDAPHGHGHVQFEDVRVPLGNMVLGAGRGFEIIQGRLGPGRIHHCMRTIGAAERALEWMLMRVDDDRRVAFGKKLRDHGVVLEWIAKSRIGVDAARLTVLNAAVTMDERGPKAALREIAQAKVLVPRVVLQVLDRAVQTFGAMGVSQDTPLAYSWAQIRTLRIADGPDEVHLQQLGRLETKRSADVTGKIQRQRQEAERLLALWNVRERQPGPSKAKL